MTGHRGLLDSIIETMAKAAYGDREARLQLPEDPDLEDPLQMVAMGLNVLLDDLAFRQAESANAQGKLLEERRRRLQEAEEAIRLRDDFIAIASHELNTPLTSLLLSLDNVKHAFSKLTSGPPPRSLVLAERSTHRISRLVDQLLSVVRIQSRGQLSLRLQEGNLVQLIQDVADAMQHPAQSAGCTLTVEAPRPVLGRWDLDRLEQVAENLLSNAIKFGAEGSVEVSVTGDQRRGRLVVRDHGIGIPSSALAHVFDRFQRAVSARQYGGLGLGLYIAREIVRAHGGTISVESVPHEATTFTVELPLEPPVAEGSS